MNPRLIDELTENLENEIEVQNHLLDTLRRQRLHLLEGETSATEELTGRIGSLLEKTGRNASRRAALLRRAGIDPASDAPVATVADRVPEDAGERLLGLRRTLVGLAAEVRSLNQFNAGLVRRSAEVVESLLHVFTGQRDVPSYGLAGARARSRPAGVLLDREM